MKEDKQKRGFRLPAAPESPLLKRSLSSNSRGSTSQHNPSPLPPQASSPRANLHTPAIPNGPIDCIYNNYPSSPLFRRTYQAQLPVQNATAEHSDIGNQQQSNLNGTAAHFSPTDSRRYTPATEARKFSSPNISYSTAGVLTFQKTHRPVTLPPQPPPRYTDTSEGYSTSDNVSPSTTSRMPARPIQKNPHPPTKMTREVLLRQLSELDSSEEKHLRRLMQVDDNDDCTALSRLFFQESTMVHGVARAAKLGSDLRRFLWIALVLLCLGGFTWQTCNLLLDFFTWPVTVVTQMEHTRTITFPSISVCNMNKIMASKVESTRFSSLQELDQYAEESLPQELSKYLERVNKTGELRVCRSSEKDGDMWQCPGAHYCIPREWRCNGKEDCPNNQDEIGCAKCLVEHWEVPCPGGGWAQGCIKFWEMCDGIQHCSDGSDEDANRCANSSCASFSQYEYFAFQCESSPRCIWSYYLGDTIPDCPDGEDEDPELLKKKAEIWDAQWENGTGSSFGALNQRCGDLFSWVPQWWLCDGRNHCRNGFDEVACERNKTCSPGSFLCEEGYNCIEKEWACDGLIDCPQGSDEDGCPGRIDCASEGLLQCSLSTWCIDESWMCNGHGDCLYEEDEDKITCAKRSCKPNQVKCPGHLYACIDDYKFCDGFADCPNGLDEMDCDVISCGIVGGSNGSQAKFEGKHEEKQMCADGSRCILSSWLCDGVEDCATPVDERNCANKDSDCSSAKDAFEACSHWAKLGYCQISSGHYKFMKENCRLTCHFCRDSNNTTSQLLLGEDMESAVSNKEWKIYYHTSVREDYSDVVGLGSMITLKELKHLGHQKEDFIIQCSFDGQTCDPNWFREFQTDVYGNCWTFNDHMNQHVSPMNISQAGVQHALQMTLFLDTDNYLGLLSPRVGARLSIQSPKQPPMPDELGITLTPGIHTSIGIRQRELSRLKNRYGQCRDEWPVNLAPVIGNNTNVNQTYDYSYLACNKLCIQERLWSDCKCVESLMTGNRTLCNVVDKTVTACRNKVYEDYTASYFGCGCQQACSETLFSKTVSESTWPSEKYMYHLYRRLLNDESPLVKESVKNVLLEFVQMKINSRYNSENRKNSTDSTGSRTGWDLLSAMHDLFKNLDYQNNDVKLKSFLQKNFLRVEIYFEDLSFEVVRETPQYGWEHILSNIGGALGLWLGLSIITVFEFCELIFDLHRIVISNNFRKRQIKRKSLLSEKYLSRRQVCRDTINSSLAGH